MKTAFNMTDNPVLVTDALKAVVVAVGSIGTVLGYNLDQAPLLAGAPALASVVLVLLSFLTRSKVRPDVKAVQQMQAAHEEALESVQTLDGPMPVEDGDYSDLHG